MGFLSFIFLKKKLENILNFIMKFILEKFMKIEVSKFDYLYYSKPELVDKILVILQIMVIIMKVSMCILVEVSQFIEWLVK